MKKYVIESGGEIGVKRFYLPVVIEVTCPHCKTVNEIDLENYDYLSYPQIGEQSKGVVCDNCDTDFEYLLTLNIELIVQDKE